MPKDINDFAAERQDSNEPDPEIIQAEIAQSLPYNSPYSRQLQPRRDGNGRWIVLAAAIGAVVALAFVNLLAR